MSILPMMMAIQLVQRRSHRGPSLLPSIAPPPPPPPHRLIRESDDKPLAVAKARPPRDPMGPYAAIVIIWGVITVLALLKIFINPIYERNTFNRFTTGPKATYIDALCCELKVEAKQ